MKSVFVVPNVLCSQTLPAKSPASQGGKATSQLPKFLDTASEGKCLYIPMVLNDYHIRMP